jgi:hypothetical protein
MIPSGISKRFTNIGMKMKIKLHGRLVSVLISERGMIKKVLNVFSLGQIKTIHYARTDNHCRTISASCFGSSSDIVSLSVHGLVRQ